jgi:hypothetical protein
VLRHNFPELPLVLTRARKLIARNPFSMVLLDSLFIG